MQTVNTSLPGVVLVRPKKHGDDRGWFAEMFNTNAFAQAGLPASFEQDNQSMSVRGVLRGLHYQLGQPQGKLVRCISGHIWDVAVDLRRSSPTFGQSVGVHLRPLNEDGNPEALWIPEGFGHGFVVLSETAEVFYKATRLYYPAGDRSVRWDDPKLAIPWPLEALGGQPPLISAKDANAKALAKAELFD